MQGVNHLSLGIKPSHSDDENLHYYVQFYLEGPGRIFQIVTLCEKVEMEDVVGFYCIYSLLNRRIDYFHLICQFR